MLRSLELRWFYKGTIPKKIINWFYELPGTLGVESEPPRNDYYLSAKGLTSLGLKLSRKRLEIKVREKDFNFVSSNGRNIGIAEYWTRYEWSEKYPLTEADPILQKFDWVKVKKSRHQRKYRIENDLLVQVPVLDFNAHVAIEIVSLNVNEQSWWTLALDSYDKGEDMQNKLEFMANILLSNLLIENERSNSYGYPTWLLQLDK
jgi:hypothetical protein